MAEHRPTEILAFTKQVSDALLKVRPLGGSELFVKRFGEYFADPIYCGEMIEDTHRRLHAAHISRVRAERERDALMKALEPFALISSEGVVTQAEGHVTITTTAEYFHRAAAALSALGEQDRVGGVL